jgi:hypothetical protein
MENVAVMSALLNLNSSIAALAMVGANAATATATTASNVLFICRPRCQIRTGIDKEPVGCALVGNGQSSAFLRQLGIGRANQRRIH